MRSRIAFAQFLLRLLRIGVGVVPACVLVFLAYIYLSRCFATLTAPGVPVRVQYQGVDGNVTAYVASYSIDISQLAAHVNGLDVQSEKGAHVSASDATVRLDGGVTDVYIHTLSAKVERLKDGTFDLTSLGLKPTGAPDTSHTRIKVDSADLQYIDAATPGFAKPTAVHLDQIVGEGSMGNWSVSSSVSALGVQKLPVAVDFLKNQTGRLEARFDNQDLTTLTKFLNANHLIPPDIAQVTAGSVKANGNLSFAILEKGYDSSGHLSVSFSDLRHPRWINSSAGQIDITGDGQTMGLVGNITTGGTQIKASGTAELTKVPTINATVQVLNLNQQDLGPDVRSRIPKGLVASGIKGNARLLYKDGKFTGLGNLAVAKVTMDQKTLSNLAGRFAIQQNQLAIAIDSGSFEQVPFTGAASLVVNTGAIQGWLQPKGDVGPALAKYLPKELSLHGKAAVAISGTISKPLVHVTTQGSGRYTLTNGSVLDLHAITAEAALVGDQISVKGNASGPSGQIEFVGQVPVLASKPLGVDVAFTGVNLATLDKRISGISEGSAHISGTISDPQIDGTVTAVGSKYTDQDIPLAQSTIKYKSNYFYLNGLDALFDGGSVQGDVAVNIQTNALSGNLKGQGMALSRLELSDSVGTVAFQGTVGGTIDHPAGNGTANVSGGYLAGYRIDSGTATIAYANDKATSNGFTVVSGDGRLTGTFALNVPDMKWQADITSKKMAVERYKNIPAEYGLAGTSSGQIHLEGQNQHIVTGTAKISVDDVSAFDHDIGAGPVEATFANDTVTFNGTIGNDQRYVQIDPSTYDWVNNKAQVSGSLTNLTVSEIANVAVNRIKDMDPKVKDLLKKVDAHISSTLAATWDGKKLDLEAPAISADDVSFEGRPAGTITASIAKHGDETDVSSFKWTFQNAILQSKGQWTDGGPVSGNLMAVNVDAKLVNEVYPSFPLASGDLSNLIANLDGTSDHPHVVASLAVSKALVKDSSGQPLSTPFDVSLYDLEYRDREITAKGDFTVESKFEQAPSQSQATPNEVRGITGTIDADIPLDALNANPTKQFRVTAALGSARPLASLASYFPSIDAKRTSGLLDGGLTVYGDSKDTRFTGKIALTGVGGKPGATLGIDNLGFTIQNLVASLNATETGLDASTTFASSAGGTGAFNLHLSTSDLLDGGFSLEALRDKTDIKGSLTANHIIIKGTIPGTAGASSGTINGNLDIAGNVAAPSISGSMNLGGLVAVVPLFIEAGAAGAEPPINPRFNNIQLSVDHKSVIDTPVARISMGGSGELSGRLSDPIMHMSFGMDGGTIRLLTHRVTVEPGSTVALALEGHGAAPRLDMNLRGRSNVTTQGPSGAYQTYVVNVNVQGNLAGTEPLSISGTSDPPGLSSEAIASIIDERSFLTDLANNANGQGTGDGLRSSLYSLAIPSLTDFLTTPLAQSLGLDYLNIDYNPFDQGLLVVGKRLNDNLSLQYLRQLQAPVGGGPQRAELTLSYHIPSRNPILSQMEFTLSQTEQVPWRVGLSYATRF